MSNEPRSTATLPALGYAAALMVVFAFGPIGDALPGLQAAQGFTVLVLLFLARGCLAAPTADVALLVALLAWVTSTTAMAGGLSSGVLFAHAAVLALYLTARRAVLEGGAPLSGLVLLSTVTIWGTVVTLFDPGVGADGHELYFVGGKNALALAFLPMIVILRDLWLPRHRLLVMLGWASILAATTAIFIGGSGAGRVVVVALLPYILTRRRLVRRRALWLLSIPAIYLALLMGWAFAASARLRQVVEGGLEKDVTLTGRTMIWDFARQQIAGHPLGQGRRYSAIHDRFGDVAEAHNLALEALMAGGWIALTLMALLLAWITLSNPPSRNPLQGRLVYIVWVACLLGTVESYTFHFGLWVALGAVAGVTESMRIKLPREAQRSHPRLRVPL